MADSAEGGGAKPWRTIAAKVAAIGPVFDMEMMGATRALYVPAVAGQSADGVTITQDIAYGAHERHRLDLYAPAAGQGHPVMVFIHGGGFVGGAKALDESFYNNLGVWFAKRGFLTIAANYRLAPDHKWPAGAEDVGAVVAWAKAHAREHGGDPAQIFVAGHSAGACHVAGYLFSPELHPKDGSGVAGGILLSGVYKTGGDAPGLNVYFGDDPEVATANCPISRVAANKTPILIGVMEYDPAFIASHSYELALAMLNAHGQCPKFAWFDNHNHLSTVLCFGSGQDDVGDAMVRFAQDVAARNAKARAA